MTQHLCGFHQNMLSRHNYEIVGEAETKSRYHKVSEIKPDIVTMDITMPRYGLTSLKEILA